MAELSDLTAQCIRCGFCLESCPTFIESGKETASPRGRIYLVRSAVEGSFSWTEGIAEHLDGCLGCRACETACPSGVRYGEILEQARQEVETRRPQRAKKALLDLTANPRLFGLASRLPGRRMPGFLSRALTKEKSSALKPVPQSVKTWTPLDNLPPVKGKVVLWQGCAMRVLYPNVHEATRRLLRRLGFESVISSADCCGALHAHNGYLREARAKLAESLRVISSDTTIIVNSAGCGSWMKDAAPGRPIYDISEFLWANGGVELMQQSRGLDETATYHDACHLAHGQRIRSQPREMLAAVPNLKLVELNESDHCCGSAGIYNVLQPSMAQRLGERKWKNIEATGARIVVLGNPGCHAWIAQQALGSSVDVLHLAEILERAFA